MNIKEEIKRLQENRLLRNKEEVQSYEEAIEKLLLLNDANLVSDLCTGFDDKTENDEVMFGLIHAIESLEDEGALLALAKTTSSMMQYAEGWVRILHYRILNNPTSRKVYANILKKIDIKTQKSITNLLIDIKDSDLRRFKNSVDEVLEMLE